MSEDRVTVDSRPQFETKRLLLRPFRADDEEAVFTICGQREIAANTRTVPHPYPREQATIWIKNHPELWLSGKAAIFAVCWAASGELVGAAGLEINETDQNAELGYWVDKNRWGQGIATEAAAGALKFGFEELQLHRIFAHHISSNPASGRVMEKIGMAKEGVMRGHIRKWGSFRDVVVYAALKHDQEQVRTGFD